MIRYATRSAFCWIVFVSLLTLTSGWVASAAPPVKLTNDVATTADLTAEVRSLLTTIDQGLAVPESYNERQGQLKRAAVQIVILAQALADHAGDSPVKLAAPSLRNSAIGLARASTYDEAMAILPRLKESLDGKSSGTPAVEVDWGKLSRAGAMMGIMKERSESVRKALRRPKDPEVESRHAMAIALMALVVHADPQAVKNPADLPAWQEASVELQQQMSRAAAAMKRQDGTAADHFRMGMEACDKCHLKFKP